MKSNLSFALLAAVAFAVVTALPRGVEAQSKLPPRDQPSISVQETASTGERTYVVQAGDSLWAIAEELYGEPWYWPSLWSYNPQITNPHLIFPGDLLYLSRRASAVTKTKVVTFSSSRYDTKSRPISVLARRVGYISERDYRESGVIEASREEKNMLGELDETYARFRIERCKPRSFAEAATGDKAGETPAVTGPCVRNDDRFVLYRVEREVFHPVTKQRVGFKINFLGEGKVLFNDKPLVKMLLTKSYTEISRGDLVTNLFQPLEFVRPARNEKELFGVIVDFHHESTAAGQEHYVYIDKGTDDGVKRGNRFAVLFRGDGLFGATGKALEDFPDEQIGEAMVVEPYARYSLAILTRSVREIERGMAAVMPKDY